MTRTAVKVARGKEAGLSLTLFDNNAHHNYGFRGLLYAHPFPMARIWLLNGLSFSIKEC
jgi:hypothetical protein